MHFELSTTHTKCNQHGASENTVLISCQFASVICNLYWNHVHCIVKCTFQVPCVSHTSVMVGGTKSADTDERFQHIATDPRFRTLRRSKQKVKADSRWRSMLKDERFTHKATTIDKRGRPKYTSMKEDYRRLVRLSWYLQIFVEWILMCTAFLFV